MAQKDLLARLADAGEEAIQRLASSPGADRVTGVVTNLRDQLDALGSKVRGMEGLERRVEALERKVARLSSSSSEGTRKSSTSSRKSGTSRKTSRSKKKT